MAYDIGPKIGIEGEAEFRKAINELNTSFKTLGTEMAAVTSAFDKNDKSSQALTAQNGVLNKQIDTQRQKLEQLNSGLAQSAAKYGENDKVTQGWQQAVNKATAELNKMDRELAENNKNIALQESNWTKMGKSLDTIGSKMKTVGEGLSSVGQKMSMSLTAPIAAGGAAAFKFAADLKDAVGASDQVFKNASNDIKGWADSLESYYGVAEGEALSYANTMGTMLQNIGGLSEAEASKQSQTLVELAGDLTAMFGGTTESAVQALTGALKGNNSMLDNYGMGVNETTIKAKALEMGLISEGEQLDLAGKQAATLALIMEQTADAQGQAARESEGASGSMRGLQIELKNVATEIGGVLLPIFTPFVAKLKEIVQRFGELSPETQKMILIIAGLAAVIGPVVLVIGHLVTAVGAIAGVFGAVSGAVAAAGGALAIITGPIGIAVGVIAGLVAVGVLLYKNWDTITAKAQETWTSVTTTITATCQGIQQFLSTTWTDITTGVTAAWNGIGEYFTSLWQGITNGLSNAWKVIADSAVGVWTNIKDSIVNTLLGIFYGINEKFQDQIELIKDVLGRTKQVFQDIWEAIKLVVLGPVLLLIDLVTGNFTKLGEDSSQIFQKMRDLIGSIFDNLSYIILNIALVLSGTLKKIWTDLTATAEGIWKGLKDFLSKLWEDIKTAAVTAWNALKTSVIDICTSIVDGAKNLWNGLLIWFGELPGKLQIIGSDMFTSMKNGVMNTISTVKNAIVNGITGAIEWIKALPSQAVTWGKDMIMGIVKGIENAAYAVRDAVKGVAQSIRSFLHFSVPDEGPLTDYESWMPDFMGGLASGIEENKFKVAQAIQGLSTDMTLGVKYKALPSMSENVTNKPARATTGNSGLSVTITNFVNNRAQDVQALAEELEFYRKQVSLGRG